MTSDATLFPVPEDLSAVEIPPQVLKDWGTSREGRPIQGVSLGRGPLQATLIAGAHAEEPAGPAFLRSLVGILSHPDHPDYGRLLLPREAGIWAGKHLLDAFTLHVVPQMNPDGEAAAVASGWLQPMPGRDGYFCPSASQFQRLARREKPGEDIEFGWPWSSEELTTPQEDHPVPHIPPTSTQVRPENRAVAGELLRIFNRPRESGRPLVFHGSLHGMAFATGAWCLIGRSWTLHRRSQAPPTTPLSASAVLCSSPAVSSDRSLPLRQMVASAVFDRGLPLHDMDRAGEKGFDRLGPGFATAPDVWSMRHHFLGLPTPDPDTAARMRPSSMDFVRGLGLDPLVVVSEVPLFLLYGDQAPERRNHQSVVFDQGGCLALDQLSCEPPGQSVLDRFRKRLVEQGAGEPGEEPSWVREFKIVPVPATMQVGTLGDMVLAGLICAAAQADQPAED